MTTGVHEKRHGRDEKPNVSMASSTVLLALSLCDMDESPIDEDAPLREAET
jgi:hypothetical protein